MPSDDRTGPEDPDHQRAHDERVRILARRAGLDVDEARRWIDVGAGPYEASAWLRSGRSLSEAELWLGEGVNLTQAREAEELGVSPEVASRWHEKRGRLEHLLAAVSAGLDPEKALPWSVLGIDVAERPEAIDLLDPVEYAAWVAEDFSLDEMLDAHRRGSDINEAIRRRDAQRRKERIRDRGTTEPTPSAGAGRPRVHEQVSLARAAEMLDVPASTLRSWASRHRGDTAAPFPEPVEKGLWEVADIAAWVDKRIARRGVSSKPRAAAAAARASGAPRARTSAPSHHPRAARGDRRSAAAELDDASVAFAAYDEGEEVDGSWHAPPIGSPSSLGKKLPVSFADAVAAFGRGAAGARALAGLVAAQILYQCSTGERIGPDPSPAQLDQAADRAFGMAAKPGYPGIDSKAVALVALLVEAVPTGRSTADRSVRELMLDADALVAESAEADGVPVPYLLDAVIELADGYEQQQRAPSRISQSGIALVLAGLGLADGRDQVGGEGRLSVYDPCAGVGNALTLAGRLAAGAYGYERVDLGGDEVDADTWSLLAARTEIETLAGSSARYELGDAPGSAWDREVRDREARDADVVLMDPPMGAPSGTGPRNVSKPDPAEVSRWLELALGSTGPRGRVAALVPEGSLILGRKVPSSEVELIVRLGPARPDIRGDMAVVCVRPGTVLDRPVLVIDLGRSGRAAPELSLEAVEAVVGRFERWLRQPRPTNGSEGRVRSLGPIVGRGLEDGSTTVGSVWEVDRDLIREAGPGEPLAWDPEIFRFQPAFGKKVERARREVLDLLDQLNGPLHPITTTEQRRALRRLLDSLDKHSAQ